MKFFTIFLAACLCVSGIFAQGENTKGISQADYDKSLAAFKAMKKRHQNCYQFDMNDVAAGYSSVTTMVVRQGKVVERWYKSTAEDAKNTQYNIEWKEQGAEVGQHKGEGYAPMTLENVYMKAGSLVEVRKKQLRGGRPKEELRYYSFGVDRNGIILTVGFTVVGCVDNCFSGYKLRHVSWCD
jgi:hypothetical protein